MPLGLYKTAVGFVFLSCSSTTPRLHTSSSEVGFLQAHQASRSAWGLELLGFRRFGLGQWVGVALACTQNGR